MPRGKKTVEYNGPTEGSITVPCPKCLMVFGNLRRHMETVCYKDMQSEVEAEVQYQKARIYMTEWTPKNIVSNSQLKTVAEEAGFDSGM